ncbi:GNAT family N-acetyltransferase [Rhodococcus sp. HNM0569]|nr:GNAT family N-acetyltransferase [Rhodococcus sp. HNM0569]NLU83278.1 GNAT family N-acetyltransferase [Rhodococcus sp. HNM0569]
MAALEVRPYRDDDSAALAVLYPTVGAGSPTASLWGDPESEAAIYLFPYVELEPESFFVAVLDGELVGYLAGCVDTAAFPTESARMQAAFARYKPFLRPTAMRFFLRSGVDALRDAVRRVPVAGDFVDPRWPAHLHIDVAEEARGTGAADALMEAWLDRLRWLGSPGCHLQTLRENARGVAFFERMGFRAYGSEAAVPGLRFRGARVRQVTMVREL